MPRCVLLIHVPGSPFVTTPKCKVLQQCEEASSRSATDKAEALELWHETRTRLLTSALLQMLRRVEREIFQRLREGCLLSVPDPTITATSWQVSVQHR